MTQPYAATDLTAHAAPPDLPVKPTRVNFLEVNGTASLASPQVPDTRVQPARDNMAAVTGPALDFNHRPDASAASQDVSRSLNRVLADARGMSSDFQQSLDKFLTVAKQNGLSSDEIVRTLDATSRLLEGQGGQPLDEQKRRWLAESLLHNVANPGRCDQGFHNTCNVTAISKVLMAHDPAKMAEIVSFAGLNGYYKADDGRAIKLDANSLQPDSEAAGGQTVDDKRNYASQIFALVAINNYWQRQYPPMQFVEGQPSGQGDTGERLIVNGHFATDNEGNILHQPFLNCGAMIKIGQELGIKSPFLIANASADAASGILVHSEAELGEKLSALKAKGGLPAVIFVESGNKLFTGSYGKGGSGGWHVITVDNYDEKTGMVHISNQWGSANDRDVSLHLLYDATLPANKWEYAPGYLDKQQQENNLRHMFGGGAGLDKNQVWTNTEFAVWLARQRHAFEQEQKIQYEIDQLQKKLDAAIATNNQIKIEKLRKQIQQLQGNIQH